RTTDREEAEAVKGRIELTLLDLKRGRLTLPPDADFWQFVLSDGKLTQKVEAPTVLPLDQLFTRYEEEMPPGTMEANSLGTFRLHKKHLLHILGSRTNARAVTTSDVQRYVNERSTEKYRGKPISPRTIKKEAATLRAVWNWGKLHGLVTGDAPTKGLKYEKEDQKPPFQTWEQIEQRIARGGLKPEEVDQLWHALFLNP